MLTIRKPVNRGVLLGLVVALAVPAAFFAVMSLSAGPGAQAQVQADIVQVTPEGDDHGGEHSACLVETGPGSLLVVYETAPPQVRHSFYTKTSADGGATWSVPSFLIDVEGPPAGPDLILDFDSKVRLVYSRWDPSNKTENIYTQSSADGGLTWSPERVVNAGPQSQQGPSIVQTNTNRLIVAWQEWPQRVLSCPTPTATMAASVGSSPCGSTTPLWSRRPTGPTWLRPSAATSGRSTTVTTLRAERWGINYQVSKDNGATWSAPTLVQDRGWDPTVTVTSLGDLVIAYTDNECFDGPLGGYCQQDIWYTTSADEGATWSAPTAYTAYHDRDERAEVAKIGQGFGIVWESERHRSSPDYTQRRTIWFGDPSVNQDIDPPPAVVRLEHFPVPNPVVGEEVRVVARIVGDCWLSAQMGQKVNVDFELIMRAH